MIKKKEHHVFDRNSLIIEKLPAYLLFAAIIWIAWNLLIVVQPFLMVLIFSAIVATVTFPIYTRFEKWFKGRKALASIVTCLLVIFAIIIPITLFMLVLAGQVVDLYKIVNNFLQSTDFTSLMKWQKGNFFYDISGTHSTEVMAFIQQNMESLKNGLTESAKFISTFAAKQSAKLAADLALTIFNLLLMGFSLYFFYVDGRQILKRLMILSPIPMEYEKEIFRKFDEISRATLFGTFMTAVAQGLVAWIGFAIAGVPSAFFWATAVSIFSLVPTIGTSIVWLPMGVIMLLSGNLWGAFVLIWGISLVSTVDNVLRVVFLSSATNLNPLLTFISIFGGILAFGLIGVVFGPMLLVLFLTLLHIYELEYAEFLGNTEELGLDDPVFPADK